MDIKFSKPQIHRKYENKHLHCNTEIIIRDILAHETQKQQFRASCQITKRVIRVIKGKNNSTVNIKHSASSHSTIYLTRYHLLGDLGVAFRVERTLEDLEGT